jgi:mono/diheme cytochrome c family protein
MTVTRATCTFCLVLLAVPAPIVLSQEQVVTSEAVVSGRAGPDLFRAYCASCHGVSAKGDGQLADSLRFRPADLTLLAKHNKGVFDAEKVHRIIDGRNPVKGHGGPDMPVWGDAFRRATEGYSEKAVADRIQVLVDYVKSLQVK